VVLIHGGVAHARWWDHVAPLLTTGDRRRVVALDLSGHGDSGRRDQYSIGTWADEVAALVSHLEFEAPPIIVGHSMGGLVALTLAERRAELVGGTVVVDTRAVEHTSAERAENDRRAAMPTRVYRTRRDAIDRFRPVPGQSSLPYVRAHVASTSVRECADGWTWKFDPRIFGGQDFVNTTLSGLRGRVLMLRAEHGISTSGVDRLLDLVGGVTSVEIAAAGHHIMLDQPLALVAALRLALEGWQPLATYRALGGAGQS
jgi:pimeloyl-ACP methyl ester carboxylesterase